MRCFFYFFLIAASLNAQDNSNIRRTPPAPDIRHFARELADGKLNAMNLPRQFKMMQEDTTIEYAPLVTYAYTETDTGYYDRKDSSHYNSNGVLLYRLTKSNITGGGWNNSSKDSSYFQTTTGGEIYTIHRWLWQDSAWADDDIISTEYNAEGQVLSIHGAYYNGPDSFYQNMEFDYSDGALYQMTTYNGDALTLLNSVDRTTFTYNSGGKTTEQLQEKWNAGVWVNLSKVSNVYDANNFLIQSTRYLWEAAGWKIISDDYYENDSAGTVINKLTKSMQDSVLTDSYQVTYTYNEFGTLIYDISMSWIDSGWVNTEKEEFTYNDLQLETSYVRYHWSGDTTWLIMYKYEQTYDENGNLLTAIESSIFGNPFTKIEYTYDEFGNRITGRYFDWVGSNWSNRNGTITNEFETYYCLSFETEYEYVGKPVAVDDDYIAPDIFSLNQNYPNPFNPETKISFSLPATGKASLKIYDMLGREVAELINGAIEKGTHTVNFSGRNLSSGVYIYRLQSGSFTESKKMMLLK
jgi:hypothetical protein